MVNSGDHNDLIFEFTSSEGPKIEIMVDAAIVNAAGVEESKVNEERRGIDCDMCGEYVPESSMKVKGDLIVCSDCDLGKTDKAKIAKNRDRILKIAKAIGAVPVN